MLRYISQRRVLFASVFAATVVLLVAPIGKYATAAETACPPGQVYGDITAQLRARGLTVPSGTMGCSGDARLLGLNCPIGDPVQYLLGKRVGIPEYEIQRMGSSFACNLARFIDAGEKAGQTIKIYSGARNFRQPGPGADCQRVPCVPSTHELGCAADLTFNGARQVEAPQCPGNAACVWAHQNVNQFGLQFRLMPQNGFPRPEPWHIELAGAQGPANLQSRGYCPDTAGTPTPGTPTPGGFPGQQNRGGAPMSGLPNSQTFPQQQVACRQGYASIQGQCVPQQFSSTQSPYDYMYPSGSTTPVSVSASTSQVHPAPRSTDISAIDRIAAIANPPSTTTTATTPATSSPIALISSVREGVQITPSQNEQAQRNAPPGANMHGAQTFTSSDMRDSGSYRNPTGSNTTFLFILLENLRQTLLRIISYTQPFGGAPVPAAGSEQFE